MMKSSLSCCLAATVAVVASLLGAVFAADPAAEATWELDCNRDLIVTPPSDKMIKFGGGGKLSFDPTTGNIASDQMTQIFAKLDAVATELVAVKGELETVKNAAAAAEEAQNNALSNVVYSNQIHPGGTLDFTPGSASLAALEQTLVGAKVFLSTIIIKGTDIQGSVVSRLLKDAATISGSLYCYNNQASFADGDAELVFESLASVTGIEMQSNNDKMQRFTSASFPALPFVQAVVRLNNNPMLKTISMPNLVSVGNDATFQDNAALASLQLPSLVIVGHTFLISNNPMLETISMPNLVSVSDHAYFHKNPALTSLQLPSLVTVEGNFAIFENPSLATGKVQVSQDFESVGGTFTARDMMDGFECTAENGLGAVAAKSPAHLNNVATCRGPIRAGGTLDFTPGSDSLAILEQSLVGVTEFSNNIFIWGAGIQGSVVSRLLKDATTISGSLYCRNNQASFADGDAELVFESLASVAEIYMYGNTDESKQRFTGASFPALTDVPGNVPLYDNPMLETISMPNLVGVGGYAYFQNNAALTSLQLPSLVTVGSNFAIRANPSLAADKVQVSQDFESAGRLDAFSMMDGFECTDENGLGALVIAASTTDSRNVATCRK